MPERHSPEWRAEELERRRQRFVPSALYPTVAEWERAGCPKQPDQHDLPEGVECWVPGPRVMLLRPIDSADAGYIRVSDLPAIRAAAVEARVWREAAEDHLAAIAAKDEEIERLKESEDQAVSERDLAERCAEAAEQALPRELERLAEEFDKRAQIEAEKRAKVKKEEVDDRASGKLAKDRSYADTWNYHEGLACAYVRAASRLRERAAELRGGDAEPLPDRIERLEAELVEAEKAVERQRHEEGP